MKSAFTLVEIMLVSSLLVILMVLTLPIALNYYRRQIANEAFSSLASDLRQQRNQAAAGKMDSKWGLYQQGNSYTLFTGNSFASRNTALDTVITLDSGLSLSGASEIVFSKGTGTTTATSLVLAADNENYTIYVDNTGKIGN
jgi:type II secretory pathway pseudopilin PulG